MITDLEYRGWKAVALKTSRVELVIPLEIGPRIISARIGEGPNLFCNVDAEMGKSGEEDWHLRGGHRLWTSPEHPERTYERDNFPVTLERAEDGASLTVGGRLDERARMRKAIKVEIVDEATFRLTHSLRNENLWPVACAPWSLTVCEYGGYGVVPLLPKGTHAENLLPACSLVPWPYTDFAKPCWDFHREFIGIDVAANNEPQKLGISAYPGWSAYWQEGGTFVKQSTPVEGAAYPDFGSCFEAFCCDFMIELETLGPLKSMEPGEEVELVEYWGFFDNIPRPDTDEAFAEGLLEAVQPWVMARS